MDQPAWIGALPVVVVRAPGAGRLVARPGHLPHRRLHPGQAKTDARDAYVIADATRGVRVSPRVQHKAVLELLSRGGGPAGLREPLSQAWRICRRGPTTANGL